jgi:hypothetical protein
VRVRRGTAAWGRRAVIALVLLGAAIIPGRASSQSTSPCTGSRCNRDGSVLWASALSGPWIAEGGVSGTVPAAGEAYAASSDHTAVVAAGLTVTSYRAATGQRGWQLTLTGLPPDSVIIGIRAWPSVIAVGVAEPGGKAGQRRAEVIVSASTGRQIRAYPAAYYGGAAWANSDHTVIIGGSTVTSYAIGTGRVTWQRQTGPVAQAWLVVGHYLYVGVASGGSLLSGPITALRRIDLTSGAERIIHLRNPQAGTLDAVVDGVALLTGSDGLRGYSIQDGRLLWQRATGVLDLVDASQDDAYIATGNSLSALDLGSGRIAGRPAPSVAAGLYAVRSGIALGLDEGSHGDAWGYDMSTRRVVWSSMSLPWPHFFVDLSGLGGSAGQDSAVTLLATCAAVGSSAASGGAPSCQRPELTAIKY